MGPKVDGFVRILTKDQVWIGGYASAQKFISAYPEGREIFLDFAYEMTADGEFGEPIPDSEGVWINCADALVVQLISANSNDDSEDFVEEQQEPSAAMSRLAQRGRLWIMNHTKGLRRRSDEG